MIREFAVLHPSDLSLSRRLFAIVERFPAQQSVRNPRRFGRPPGDFNELRNVTAFRLGARSGGDGLVQCRRVGGDDRSAAEQALAVVEYR